MSREIMDVPKRVRLALEQCDDDVPVVAKEGGGGLEEVDEEFCYSR